MNHTRYKQLLADAARRFAADTKTHTMTVLHDDGLYRHLRFRAADHGFTAWDLIMWPGSLAIQGAHGTYTFSRETDMVGFFRTSNGVNVDYWAEKTPEGRRSVKKYSEEALLQRLVAEYTDHGKRLPELDAAYEAALPTYEEAVAAYEATPWERRWPMTASGPRPPEKPAKPLAVAELRQQVADARRDGELSYEDGARRFLAGWDELGVTCESWEADLTEYDYHFVWSCHAIRWGVEQYHAAKQAEVLVGAGVA